MSDERLGRWLAFRFGTATLAGGMIVAPVAGIGHPLVPSLVPLMCRRGRRGVTSEGIVTSLSPESAHWAQVAQGFDAS